MSKICKNCGNAVSAEAKVCEKCGCGGFIVKPDAAQPEPQAQFVPQPAAQPQFVGQPQYQQQPYGNTSSGAYAPPSPQGEGFQPPYGQPYQQQPYAQPYGQPYQQPYVQPYGPQYAPYGAPAPQKKSKKGLVIAIIAIVLVLGLAAVAAFVWPGFLKGGGIVGEWEDGNGGKLTFSADGKLTRDDGGYETEYNYKVEGDHLKIWLPEFPDDIDDYTYSIEGDNLTLYRDDGNGGKVKVGNYGRKDADGGNGGAATGTVSPIDGEWVDSDGYSLIINKGRFKAPGYEGDITVSGNKAEISVDKERMNFSVDGDTLTLWPEGGNRSEQYAVAQRVSSGGNGIEGKWRGSYNYRNGERTEVLAGNNGTLSFGKGGKYSYTRDSDGKVTEGSYSVNGSLLIIKEVVSTTYTLEGDTLTLYYTKSDGEYGVETYTRGSGKSEAANGGAVGSEVNGETAESVVEVDHSLVGRWEDEEGLELNIYADGTGDYDGDYITFIAASNGVLNWKDKWGVASYRYAVNDGVLVLTGDNGETLRFYR